MSQRAPSPIFVLGSTWNEVEPAKDWRKTQEIRTRLGRYGVCNIINWQNVTLPLAISQTVPSYTLAVCPKSGFALYTSTGHPLMAFAKYGQFLDLPTPKPKTDQIKVTLLPIVDSDHPNFDLNFTAFFSPTPPFHSFARWLLTKIKSLTL